MNNRNRSSRYRNILRFPRALLSLLRLCLQRLIEAFLPAGVFVYFFRSLKVLFVFHTYNFAQPLFYTNLLLFSFGYVSMLPDETLAFLSLLDQLNLIALSQ